jgi:hypothetical protein
MGQQKNQTSYYNSGCLVCGEELIYPSAGQNKKYCYFCNKEMKVDCYCENGHFVCDNCHSSNAFDLIEKYCVSTMETDPYKIVLDMMDNRVLTMHGPEHHFLVPAALLAAYFNLHNNPDSKDIRIRRARERAEKVPGGFCGTHGNCGAAVGAGIYFSLVTGATPLSRESWQLSQLMTADCLTHIALAGGPRCCKRDTFIAIERAIKFTSEKLDTTIPGNTPECTFSQYNRQCLKSDCKFYGEIDQ